jgi:hypothetical protein
MRSKCLSERVENVSHTIVEELLHDLGTLCLGKGHAATNTLTSWPERGAQQPLFREFAFQCKFKRLEALHEKAIEHFFIVLQHDRA